MVEILRAPEEVFCAILSRKIRATRGGRFFGESFPRGDLKTRKKRKVRRERERERYGNRQGIHTPTPPLSRRRKTNSVSKGLGNLLANRIRYGCRGHIHRKERQTVKSRPRGGGEGGGGERMRAYLLALGGHRDVVRKKENFNDVMACLRKGKIV